MPANESLRLTVMKRLCQHLSDTIVAGDDYTYTIGENVHRGRIKFTEDDAVPAISVLENIDPDRYPRRAGQDEGAPLQKDTNEIADHVMAKGPKLMMELATRVPGLLARIIAVACNEPEEEAANEIRATWVLPLQFEALTLVAKLTFVGIDGFRLFLGNAQALAASVSAITNVKNSRQNRQKTMSTELPDGAKEFLERVPS